jgi:hypothetical protein
MTTYKRHRFPPDIVASTELGLSGPPSNRLITQLKYQFAMHRFPKPIYILKAAVKA